LSEASDGLAD